MLVPVIRASTADVKCLNDTLTNASAKSRQTILETDANISD